MDSNALQQQSGKIALGLAVVAVIFLVVRSLIFPEPPIPIDRANGTYANECCGAITLRNGTMWFGKQRVIYAIKREKDGAYVLPRQYVGVDPQYGLQIEPRNYPLLLQLDDEQHPKSITIGGSGGEYRFTR